MKDDELRRSYKKVGPLYPILVDKEGKIIDGKHRARVDPHWPKAVLEKANSDIERQKIAIIANVQRRDVSETEQKRKVNTLAKTTGWSPRRIAKELGMSYRWIVDHLSKKYKEKTGPKRIARSAIKSQENEAIPESTSQNDGFKPIPYNIWLFNSCDERFGGPYPGRIPGQIVQNVLHYFTDPGALVVDPMAGSGTTYDVCKEMGRRCLCYDISPVRDVIKKHDIREGFPSEAKNCDLIFLDPPYWRLKRKEYGDLSASANSLKGWAIFMTKLSTDCYLTLKHGGYVALLIEPFLDEKVTGLFLDLPFTCASFFETTGFVEIQRVAVPMPSQIKKPRDVEYAKRKRIMLDLNRDLIIFRRN